MLRIESIAHESDAGVYDIRTFELHENATALDCSKEKENGFRFPDLPWTWSLKSVCSEASEALCGPNSQNSCVTLQSQWLITDLIKNRYKR